MSITVMEKVRQIKHNLNGKFLLHVRARWNQLFLFHKVNAVVSFDDDFK